MQNKHDIIFKFAIMAIAAFASTYAQREIDRLSNHYVRQGITIFLIFYFLFSVIEFLRVGLLKRKKKPLNEAA